MQRNKLSLDFYHDAVCGWCFNLSPRLRRLAREFPLEIHHRTFVLQENAAEMAARFGSAAAAKAEILQHWQACRAASDRPDDFAIEAMRRADFDYPHGLPAALACKAAEMLAGPHVHWRMFDALQRAHITQARNIADWDVLSDVASGIGLSAIAFRTLAHSDECRRLVEFDRAEARALRVSMVPTVIVRETGDRLVNGPLESLRAQVQASLRRAA